MQMPKDARINESSQNVSDKFTREVSLWKRIGNISSLHIHETGTRKSDDPKD